MSKAKAVIFICPDETKNAGEGDYVVALARELEARGKLSGREYHFYKGYGMGGAEDGNSQGLPLLKEGLAGIPSIQSASLRATDYAAVQIIGVGHSTRDSVQALCDKLRLDMSRDLELSLVFAEALGLPAPGGIRRKIAARSKKIEGSYVTHLVDDKAALESLVSRDIHILASVSYERLRKIDARLAAKARFTSLESVPNTNSANIGEGLENHHRKHVETENGRAFMETVAAGLPFAVVVVNAGFEVGSGENKRRVAYLPEEANRHGFALGAHLPAGTNLLIAEGGPRNGFDKAQHGEDTLAIFKNAYLRAQSRKFGVPDVFEERFARGLPYDAVKAGLFIAQKENCVAFISNAEGYGTMDGAVQWVANTPGKKLLGMFDFQAQHEDTTGSRAENTQKYHRLGIDLLERGDFALVVNRHPERRETPFTIENGAKTVANALGFTASGMTMPNPNYVPQPR